jgi:hypothetical protein
MVSSFAAAGPTINPYAYSTGYPSGPGRSPGMPLANPPQTIAPSMAARRYDPVIQQALTYMSQIQNLPQDEWELTQMGVNLIFHSGQEAMELIKQKNIRVEFGDMGDSLAHAQWIRDENLIMINQKYKNDTSWVNLFAISEAIYHEAGHAARNGDDRSSLQEEIDCLALNTLAYRYHAYTTPAYAKAASTSRLIADGVALYARLFFDPDPCKKALVNRIIEKYGVLPPDSPDHPIPVGIYQVPLADRVMRTLHARNTGLAA